MKRWVCLDDNKVIEALYVQDESNPNWFEEALGGDKLWVLLLDDDNSIVGDLYTTLNPAVNLATNE